MKNINKPSLKCHRMKSGKYRFPDYWEFPLKEKKQNKTKPKENTPAEDNVYRDTENNL